MTATHKKSIALLHKARSCNIAETCHALNEFCLNNNQSIIDIINFSGKYDYIALRRLSQVIKYGSKVILLSNKGLNEVMLPLILWSVLDKIDSPKIMQLMLDFEERMKINPNKFKDENLENFQVFCEDEVEFITDLIYKIHFEMDRDKKLN